MSAETACETCVAVGQIVSVGPTSQNTDRPAIRPVLSSPTLYMCLSVSLPTAYPLLPSAAASDGGLKTVRALYLGLYVRPYPI